MIYYVMWRYGGKWRGGRLVEAVSEKQAEAAIKLALTADTPKGDIDFKTEVATPHQLEWGKKMHSEVHRACIAGGRGC
jgi:hypothetical protein